MEHPDIIGNIFNIQRFTIHDGPGLRTELFLKGCPLRCEWCSNPESFTPYSQVGIYKTKCISYKKCAACEEVCPQNNVLKFTRGKLTSLNRQDCTNCLACHSACPSDAIKLWGKMMSVKECMEVIRKDKGYYERSGGGITVSGGEPLLQHEFVHQLFKTCKQEGYHTCLESSLYVPWKKIKHILPYTDLIISDIKHMDPEIHKKHTKVSNDKILKNLNNLVNEGRDLILRIPIIPDFNDNKRNIEATANFILNELSGHVRTLQLLSFMRLGEEKYTSLGLPYKMQNMKINRRSFQKQVQTIAEYFNQRGIHCVVGTKEK